MKKKHYIVPTLTIVEFRGERGYAVSVPGMPQEGMVELLIYENDGSGETETFSTHSTWTDDGNNGFWQ